MGSLLEFLNQNTGAVTAFSALITAVATVVIAAFSYGTWRLYRLERERNLSFAQQLKQGLALHASNLQYLAWFYRSVKSQKDDVGRTFYDMLLMQAARGLDELAEDVPQLKKAAEHGYPEIMDALLLAERKTDSLQSQLPDLKRKLHLVSERDPNEITNEPRIDDFFDEIEAIGAQLSRPPLVASDFAARSSQFMDPRDVADNKDQLVELLTRMKAEAEQT